jgi:hypothetical protein
MPQMLPEKQAAELPPQCDPARHFEDSEPWNRVWRCRFVPLRHIHGLSVAADPGLERLIHLQSLISDDLECCAAAKAAE